jgi:hypothetical protein
VQFGLVHECHALRRGCRCACVARIDVFRCEWVALEEAGAEVYMTPRGYHVTCRSGYVGMYVYIKQVLDIDSEHFHSRVACDQRRGCESVAQEGMI